MVRTLIVDKLRGKAVSIRYRDPKTKERKSVSHSNYYPYFFVADESAEYIESVGKETGYKGVYGESLTKIVCSDPYTMRETAYNQGDYTWEANLSHANRVMVDRLQEHDAIPNYEHRTWFLDCEWSPATNRMRVIVVYDNYTDKEFVWFVEPSLKEKTSFSKYGDFEYETPALGFPDEKSMLIHFIRHMDKHDPDILTGWYVTGADIKTIFERCRANGIEPRAMSPKRSIRYEFGDWEQPIVGRMCIDLMIAFSKIWELKNGKLPAYSLSEVSKEVLGEDKVDLPDGHDTYYSDLPLYIHYCRQDVRLLPRLDSTVNALGYYTALQHLVQCEIRSTPHITQMFTILALKDKEFTGRIPSRPKFAKKEYEGANVMQPVAGVYSKIGILDVKAMYHSNVSKYGISWETLDYNGVDCGNGSKFNLESKGLLCRQMDYMTNMRNEYKMRVIMSDSDTERNKWETMQFACKSLVASMYGVAGDAKYGLYHPEVAAAITYTSRSTLQELKVEAEALGMKTIYGHTDSIFCEINTPEEGVAALKIINDNMSPIETEFEKWCPRIIIAAKNRYAGLVSWTDGKYHEPKSYFKGIELKQSRMPPIMKESMTDVIQGILNDKSETDVTLELSTLISKVVSKDIDPLDICMKGRLRQDLSKYKVLSGSSAGAAWANEYLGKNYRKDSYFLSTITPKGKYIAFDEPSEIEGVTEIGYKILAERFIVNKAKPYYELAGWSMQPLVNSLEGVAGIKWL